MQGGNELSVSGKGAVDTAGFDVLISRIEARVDDASLFRRVLVIPSREFWKDGDHAAGDPEFDFLAALQAGKPPDRERDHKRFLVFDGDGHRDCLQLHMLQTFYFRIARCVARYSPSGLSPGSLSVPSCARCGKRR